MNPDGFAWWWGEGCDPEGYRGPFSTRLEAIAEAFRMSEPGSTIAICEANKCELETSICAEGILERFEEANIENWGEDGPNVSVPSALERELGNALTATFEAWLVKHQLYTPYRFDVMRNGESMTVPHTLGSFWRDLQWSLPWQFRPRTIRWWLRRRFLGEES